jgi:aminoacyl-tRNA hydrolase
MHYWEGRRALEQRTEAVMRQVGRSLWPRLAPLYRPWLRETIFVAITGSVGKTTTKELVAGILEDRYAVAKTVQGGNQPVDIARAILRTRRRHRFAVHEVGVGRQGQDGVIDRSMSLIRPAIAVVTSIGDDHISAFGTREAIAAEKAKLVEALDERGIAVLNADDRLVLAMRERCRGRVVLYGRGAHADVRAENVSAAWPSRLAFDVVYQEQRTHVQTQLCGEHALTAALAAFATAIAGGMTLEEAATGLARVPPTPRRMFPTARDGIDYLCDDIKAPLWTLPATLAFLAAARAPRKVLVLGTISDYTGESRRVYVAVARQALEVAEEVIFIGPHASKVLKVRKPSANLLKAFNTVDAARDYLSTTLAPGDLVLLKGSLVDALDRLVVDRAPVATALRARPSAAGRPATDVGGAYVVVGLGNPGARYEGTRHNVGRACVDRLAARLAVNWTRDPFGHVADARIGDVAIRLVKLHAEVNCTGAALRRICEAEGIAPPRCILVHDDVDLAVGRVRGRLEGGGGGHRGVRSVLEMFEDNRFPRVKIGVGRPEPDVSLADYVLQPYPDTEQQALRSALDAGGEQVLRLVREIEARQRRTEASLPQDASAA